MTHEQPAGQFGFSPLPPGATMFPCPTTGSEENAVITSFSHIYHRVRDLDESIAFYTGRLGFNLLRRYDIDGRESAYVGLGDVLLEMSAARSPAELPGPDGERRLGLTVTDLDGVMAGLKGAGVVIVQEAYDARTFWGRQAAIKDPNGYIISLREWRAPDNPHFEGWQPAHQGVHRSA
jgi:lactoylglutathione lyase